MLIRAPHDASVTVEWVVNAPLDPPVGLVISPDGDVIRLDSARPPCYVSVIAYLVSITDTSDFATEKITLKLAPSTGFVAFDVQPGVSADVDVTMLYSALGADASVDEISWSRLAKMLGTDEDKVKEGFKEHFPNLYQFIDATESGE